jgi:hypothetical protein
VISIAKLPAVNASEKTSNLESDVRVLERASFTVSINPGFKAAKNNFLTRGFKALLNLKILKIWLQ